VDEKKDHEHDESFDGFTIDDLDKKFQSLSKELQSGGVTLDKVMEVSEREENESPHFRNYNPNVLDFLARANTFKECEEIIEYCLEQEEISENEAVELRQRLEKGGPNAFGKRKDGFYNPKL
jgi:hypothetical protein